MNGPSDKLMGVARQARRRLQLVRMVRRGAVGLITGAAVAVACQVAGMVGWMTVSNAWQMGGLAVNCGMIVGLGMGFVQAVSLIEAAAFLDARRKLQERFLTAVELVLAGRGQTPAGEVCVAQALSALGDRPFAGVDMIRQTRRPLIVAAMMVVLMLAGAALAWDLGTGPLEKLSTDERTALADAFDQSSPAVGAGELSNALARAAVAVRRVDDDELADLLAELRREGFRPVELTPEAIRAANALMDDPTPDSAGSPDGAGMSSETANDEMGAWVRVFDPIYRPGERVETDAEGQPAKFGDYEDSWEAAQFRAASDLDDGNIPFAYRDLIRNYFAD
jgi:hypothetical protein